MLISSCKSTKVTTSCWTTIDMRRLNLPKTGTPHLNTKKPQGEGRRVTIMIKSNPMPTGWVTHKLKNNNIKEVLWLLWRFWNPMSGFWQTFVGRVMSLLFKMLSRFVIAFLKRSKHRLISWLQSPSPVILESKKIKRIFYFYLVCCIFSISYSVLPFHLVYVFHLFFFSDVLSQDFIKHSRKVFVYIYSSNIYNINILEKLWIFA